MQFLLLKNISVQNANAIAGFTWGFPAITHFLGFTHNLSRKLSTNNELSSIQLGGCGVISHSQVTHTFGKYDKSFTQNRYQPYLEGSNKKSDSPPIIEEGKMNLSISLLIEVKGNVGNQEDDLLKFIERCCYTQKLAGGTILEIEQICLSSDQRQLKRSVMPGYALMDRSEYLEDHFQNLKESNETADVLDAWLDFSALKQAARPEYALISGHIKKNHPDFIQLWDEHLALKPYTPASIPDEVIKIMEGLPKDKKHKKLLEQWNGYCEPTEKTPAQWEYLPKPFPGFLVPIMTGYKAISKVYENHEVANTRDAETPVCFVESVHSIGEWKSPHRIDKLEGILWDYHHEQHWYLCKQVQEYEEPELDHDDL